MFAGFTDAHFDAYAERKWRSKAFNLERRAVRDALLELARAIEPELTAAGAALACEASDEHPTLENRKQVDAQHVFFTRPPDARRELDRIMERSRGIASVLADPSPQRSHVLLGVSVTHDHVFFGLRLHRDAAIDRRNLAARVAESWQADQLAALLGALPAAVTVAVDGAEQPARALSASDAAELPGRLDAASGPEHSRWLTVGRRLSRDDAQALVSGIRTEIRDVLVALVPIYQFIAWTPQNDLIALRPALAERKTVARQRGLEPGDEVTIASGMFAGRRGVVQAVDQKGMLKVLVGNVPLVLRADLVQKV